MKLQIEYIPISEIIPYNKNPRKNQKAVEIVMKSIKNFGFRNPIILDKNNVIVAGHTRLEAAEALQITEVPVIWADDLTEEQIKAFRIMDNKSHEYSVWDLDILKGELLNLENLNFNLEMTGFSEDELNIILDRAQENIYTDKVASPTYTPSNIKPEINQLYDNSKTKSLIKKIDKSNIPDKEKEFLRETANRFTIFNYDKIADYYAHSKKEEQELMEELALIIIDFNKAIELGFIELSDKLANKFQEEYG